MIIAMTQPAARPPFPPFDETSARTKVQAAEHGVDIPLR
jgi:hypothetical protein